MKTMQHAVLTVMFGISLAAHADYPLASHRYLADPSALEYNGRLYLYCSNDDDNGSGYQMKSIVCISTDDLKNWTDHGEVFRVPTDASWANYAWAPSVVYRNSRFYLYFGNNSSSTGVASSTSPTGRFKDARGSALVNSSTPGAGGSTGQWYFDPCAFVNSDGQAYLYFGGGAADRARVIRLNSDMISVSGSASAISAPYFLEASHMHKRNNTYYFTYEVSSSQGLAIRHMTSGSSPTSGFTARGNILDAPDNAYQNNHHSIVSFGGVSYIAYHNRYVSAGSTYKRNVCLDRLNYNSDGSIQSVTSTRDGLSQLKNVNPYSRVEAEMFNQQSGIETSTSGEGGMKLSSISAGDWVRVRRVDFGSTTARTFSARVHSSASGGTIELRLDSSSGTLIGTCAVPNTSGAWTTATASVSSVTGVHDLYLRFGGSSSIGGFSWWQFSR